MNKETKLRNDGESRLPPISNITDSGLDRALRRTVFESLRPVSKWLALLYLLLTVSHILVLPAEMAVTMAATSMVTTLILFALFVGVGREYIPVGWTYGIAFGIATLVWINSLLHLYLSCDIQQTTNFMLLVIRLHGVSQPDAPARVMRRNFQGIRFGFSVGLFIRLPGCRGPTSVSGPSW